MSEREPSDLEMVQLVEHCQNRLLGTLILVQEEFRRTIVDLEQAKAWLKRRAAEPPPAGEADRSEARH